MAFPRISLALALALVPCLGASTARAAQDEGKPADPVAELARLADPLADDWEVERSERAASALLGELKAALAAGGATEAFFVEGASLPNLALEPDARLTRGDAALTLWEARGTEDGGEREPASARLAAWLAPVRALGAPALAFKITRIDAARAGDGSDADDADAPFVAEVRAQASARGTDGRARQRNATWDVRFVKSPDDGDVPEGALPRLLIADVRPRRDSAVAVARPLFTDVTDAVLAGAGGEAALLLEGEDHWRARIDSLGEPHFFGHHGVAVGDVNGDERDDLYVATGTGLPNLLFVSQADGTLKELGEAAGVAWLDDTKGALLVDHDGDGDRDLVCAIGPAIVVSENDGEGHFTPVRSLRAETAAAFYSIAAADYDNDGDLDLFGVRYVKTSYGDSVPLPLEDARNGPKNHLMRNDGEAGYGDVTAAVGLDADNARFSLAATWVDYDEDGDADLYVANDFGRNNLWRNDGGKFVDVAAAAGVEDQAAGMGASWGDADGDGDLDLLVSNMFSSAGRRIAYQRRFGASSHAKDVAGIARHALGNSFFVNAGDGTFADASDAAGLRMGRWAWGARWADLLGDGGADVVVPNGFLTQSKDRDL